MSDFDFTSRLQDALDASVREFNRSRDPDQAIAKTATDYGFTPAGTQRLLETFNRARTIYHFNTAQDKTAEFRLADPEAVIRIMYGGTGDQAPVKLAAFDECLLSADYETPESDFTDTAVVKIAEAAAANEPAPPLEMLQLRATQQLGWYRQAKTAADTARAYADISRDRTLSKMASDIRARTRGDVPAIQALFLEFKEACSRDPRLKLVPDMLAEEFGAAYGLANLPKTKFASVMDTKRIDSLLADAAHVADCVEKAASSEAVRDRMEADEAEFSASVASLLHGVKTAAPVSEDFLIKRSADDDKDKAKPKEPKPLFTVGEPGSVEDVVSGTTGGYLGKGLSGIVDADVLRLALSGDRVQENKDLTRVATNLHRQLLLEDVLANDPVLSAENPETVARAYQSLLNLAPEVANQRATVVAVLRQAIHSQDAYSPYDAEQLARLNSSMRNVRGARPSVPAEVGK